MTQIIALTGVRSFSNRGVEAIVRGTNAILRECLPDRECILPVDEMKLNAQQWPQYKAEGIEMLAVQSPRYSLALLQRLSALPFDFAKRAQETLPLETRIHDAMERAQGALSLGGDKYSLDYRYPIYQVALDRLCMERRIPVFLWGASVGPFSADRRYEKQVMRHLARFDMICAREDITMDYLHSHGLENVMRCSDPAFHLGKQPIDEFDGWPEGENGTVGINLSPILVRRAAQGGRNLIEEAANFIRWLIDRKFGVLLIPHVWPLDGGSKNSDVEVHQSVLSYLGDEARGRVRAVDQNYNAPQLKWIISHCRVFIGARTHATIAALSTGVPTIFLGYSIKSRGISLDMTGKEDTVLNGNLISSEALRKMFEAVMAGEQTIRETLAARLPEVKENALKPGKLFAQSLA